MKFDYLNRSLDISPDSVGAVFLQTLKSNAKKVFLLGTALDTITRLPNYFFNLHKPNRTTAKEITELILQSSSTAPDLKKKIQKFRQSDNLY